jgi:hypothetical protein
MVALLRAAAARSAPAAAQVRAERVAERHEEARRLRPAAEARRP